MRIRVKLDVRKPLKRRKKITRRNGVEVIVNCKYERLGDFCFACGFVTHTERFCRKLLDKTNGETNREWGSWLRAIPRRASAQTKSKWLRDEGDADWEQRIGRDNNFPQSGGSGYASGEIFAIQKDGGRYNMHESRDYTNQEVLKSRKAVLTGGGSNSKFLIGPEEEELSGLSVVERKRMRGGPGQYETMDTEGGLITGEIISMKEINKEATLSVKDCAASSKNELATPALQASQSK